jgi:hypothetical protein
MGFNWAFKGLIEIFLKVMNKKKRERFDYLRQKFPRISEAEIKRRHFRRSSSKTALSRPRLQKINVTLPRKQRETRLKKHAAMLCGGKIGKVRRYRGGANPLIHCLGVQHVVETPFPSIALAFLSGKYCSRL